MIKLVQFGRESCIPCKVMNIYLSKKINENLNINFEYIDIDKIQKKDTYSELLNVIISQKKYKSLPLFTVIEDNENDISIGVIEIFHTTSYKDMDEILNKYFSEVEE